MINRRIAAAVTAVAAAVAIPLSAAAAASAGTGGFSYEMDNGSVWQLSATPASLTGADTGYADAGVVVDVGPASAFSGITVKGSGPLAVNVWIGDGPNAYTPGTHSLSSPAGFSYGFQQSNGSFWMTSGPYAGQTLTPAQIAADFAGDETYAWVGVVYSGTDVSGHVSQVNGRGAGANLSVVSGADGVIASAR